MSRCIALAARSLLKPKISKRASLTCYAMRKGGESAGRTRDLALDPAFALDLDQVALALSAKRSGKTAAI